MSRVRSLSALLIGSAALLGCREGTGPAASPSAQAVWTDAAVSPGRVSARVVGPQTVEVTGVLTGACLDVGALRARTSRTGATVTLRIEAEVVNEACRAVTSVQYRALVWTGGEAALPRTVALTHAISPGQASAPDTVLAVTQP